MALLIAGLLVLLAVLKAPAGAMAWTARFGAAAAVAALALYAALQAVDGVALKHAVDAWAAAAGAGESRPVCDGRGHPMAGVGHAQLPELRAGRGPDPDRRRGCGARRVSRPIGYLMALSGLAYLAQGWIIGAEGFSPANTIPTLAGIVLILGVVRVAAGQRMVREGRAAPTHLTGSNGRFQPSVRP